MVRINAAEERDPLAVVRDAAERGEEEIEFISGGAVLASEVMRILEEKGFQVQLLDDDGRLTLDARKGKEQEEPAPPQPPAPHPPVTAAPMTGHRPVVEPQIPVEARFPIAAPTLTPPPAPSGAGDAQGLSLVVMGRTLGRGDPELEETLVRSFLAEFARMETPPETVILLNEGVRLAVFDTSTCDHLKDMEAKGSRVLVSDLCAGHLGLTGDIGVGVIANIVDIIDAIYKAGKLLYL